MNNLPVVKSRNLKMKIRNEIPRINENIKRITKILGMGALTVASLVGFAMNSIIFLIPTTISGFMTINNIRFKKQKDLMFTERKDTKSKEIIIEQDITRIDLMTKIKELNQLEKAGVMIVQTLVGFQRYQKEFNNKKEKLQMTPLKETGTILVYPQIFSMHTHGLNIKVLQSLEDLGYIKIKDDGKETTKSLKLSQKIYKRYVMSKSNNISSIQEYFDGRDKSLLILEKYGMGALTREELREGISDILTGNVERLEQKSKIMQNIRLQLTDKEIDFDKLYEIVNDPPKDLTSKEKSAIARLGIVFNSKKGILKTANIDIQKDKYGIDRIKYRTRSYINRKEDDENRINKKNKFREMYANKISLEQQASDVKERQEDSQKDENYKNNDIEQE